MYSQIAANKRKTFFLVLGFIVLIGAISYVVSLYFDSLSIVVLALFIAVIYALISYFTSDKIALAMNRAKAIQKSDNPRLWRTVENLSITNGMPMPKVYIINESGLNAFATGRDPKHASVAATQGLLDVMDDNELEAVMAHELGHVKNFDIRVAMIVFGLVMVVSIISDFFLRSLFWGGMGGDDDDRGGNGNAVLMIVGLVALILAPLVATIIQLAVSRRREFLADATSALTTRYPEGLISALEKLRDNSSVVRTASPSTAHLYFSNPLSKKSLSTLFSTHPPIEDRIKALREMEANA